MKNKIKKFRILTGCVLIAVLAMSLFETPETETTEKVFASFGFMLPITIFTLSIPIIYKLIKRRKENEIQK